ncbi:nucleoside phosphorylase [Photobacterium lipolyticum]|uniref:Uridine phosphorylase n=1 Tax=Photobacterium lipolyticum TaxID=266810 RepID=A0A2T3N522_9GAMM|nr:nucleoside phosphorylase [Photobacterium lipolyticum]PSW07527.1 uridine phosphorylase [Photobacterium lipolyticum]
MNKQPHLLVDSKQISDSVIVCGEPNRVNRIAKFLSEVELLSDNREYRLMKGIYNGIPITICSTGIGSPSALIALEELYQCGAKKIIRVGSSGALQANIALGDLIIAEAAVRDEGGSTCYVPAAFPAYSEFELINGLQRFCVDNKYPYHQGVVRSHDSFYTDDEEKLCQYWHKKGVLGADMETSALLTVGRLRGLKVASILTNVVLYQQDVKEGVTDYITENEIMVEGEKIATQAALYALTC